MINSSKIKESKCSIIWVTFAVLLLLILYLFPSQTILGEDLVQHGSQTLIHWHICYVFELNPGASAYKFEEFNEF